jgi:hypothetical protein
MGPVRWAPLIVLVVGACSSGPSAGRSPAAELEAPDDTPYRMELDLGDSTGLSGMAVDGDGLLWIVTERDVLMVALSEDGIERRVWIDGVPEHLDVESLAWLGGQRFALGTELDRSGVGHDGDPGLILLVELNGERGQVIGQIVLPPGVTAREPVLGAGIEGLCAAGGLLVAAIEEVEVDGDRRWAPLARYRFSTGTWTGYRLALTSATGKISALACRMERGRLVVLAVERHFGVSRLLRFELPEQPGDITPRIDADITKFADQTNLNFEGAEWGDDGTIVLVVDNEWRGVTGPNELVLWRLQDDD